MDKIHFMFTSSTGIIYVFTASTKSFTTFLDNHAAVGLEDTLASRLRRSCEYILDFLHHYVFSTWLLKQETVHPLARNEPFRLI